MCRNIMRSTKSQKVLILHYSIDNMIFHPTQCLNPGSHFTIEVIYFKGFFLMFFLPIINLNSIFKLHF